MKRLLFVLILSSIYFFLGSLEPRPPRITFNLIPGKLYAGIYPGGFTGAEDDFSELDITSYERATNSHPYFVYFSHNWYKSREFPKKMVDMIYAHGSYPYIRLMLRSAQLNQQEKEDTFKLERIVNGELDNDFWDWFKLARSYNKLMFVEFGIEVNGEWFNWNGKWNGGPGIGPDNFIRAYRRIIEISRRVGVRNIVFSFHPNDVDSPNEEWNRLEKYYPGDNYIDLITTSIYGMLTPADTTVKDLRKSIDIVYARLKRLAPNKRIILIETGTTLLNPHQSQEDWANSLFECLLSNRYPDLIGFSWWNEWWHNKGNIPTTTMRVQDNPKLAEIFERNLSNKRFAK